MQIVMRGSAGMAEAAERFRTEKPELQPLTKAFLEKFYEMAEQQPQLPEPKGGVPVGEGGVFAALWRLGEEQGSGLTVNLEDIPVRQETIEICERLDVNPYRLGGGWLYVTGGKPEEGDTVIGYLTKGRGRTVIGREGTRYLTKPERNY